MVKLPSRSRPRQFRRAMQLMVDKAEDTSRLHFLLTVDTDDPQYSQYIALDTVGRLVTLKGIPAAYTFDPGVSTSKIHACNRGMEKVQEWDIVVLASDDMHCQHNGWDQQIRQDMRECFPDLDGCLWYSDGHQKDICTLPIMGRKAYERDGHIYHPAYKSLFCDNWYTDLWRERNAIVLLDQVLFYHSHPAWGKAKWDPLYKRNEALWSEDEATYKAMKMRGAA